MATSSITKNFVISGKRQVEMFADAIEASANDQTPPIKVSDNFFDRSERYCKIYGEKEESECRKQVNIQFSTFVSTWAMEVMDSERTRCIRFFPSFHVR